MIKNIGKKMIAVLLTVCLSMTALALTACGQAYGGEIDWTVDLTKPIDINYLSSNSGLPSFGKDRTAQLIERATGYKTNYSELDAANEDNEVNNALTSQKQYQMLKVTKAQYNPYVQSGTWLDLTELLTRTESGRKLYEIIDLMPGAWDSVTYTDKNGKKGIYGIPECGYTVMEDYAMVWNREHLKEIGWFDNHTELPGTITELTEAFRALQAKFGSNKNYHAFGIGGSNSAAVENIMAAFETGNQFYIDENGKVQMYVYNDGVTDYVKYMNMLKKEGIISDSWQNSSAADMCSKFAKESSSCVFLTYWWVTPLVNTIVSNGLAEKYGMTNDYATVHDELIAWKTRIRGDGAYNSKVQEKAKHIGGDAGNAYYITIPFYMAKDAVYTIDYLSKKLQSYALWYGGEEGVDWVVVDEPEDKKEDFKNNIIYMKPWEYELAGETVTGGGKWIQLTESYLTNIVDNSMYASGANVIEARSLFHLRETGFDSWPVAVPTDDTIIMDPTALCPTFEWWSPISILSRTVALRGIASAIDATDPVDAIEITRESLRTQNAKINGVSYYYWSDNISNEMTAWYNSKKG